GLYNGVFECIENITADNLICNNTQHAGYFKTWTGQQIGNHPNRGGGVARPAIGNSSQFQIQDLNVIDMIGTLLKDPIGLFERSAVGPCTNTAVNAINLHLANGTAATGWLCDNLRGDTGFNCT
ncbi:hypothetical protein BKA61DRAFT_454094, partial [Leptodontidium sp. MPI-SDFR-AT-0119]